MSSFAAFFDQPVDRSAMFWMIMTAPIMGSFLALAAERLPEGRAVVWARSTCNACERPLGPVDLLPIISFVALGGRCRRCRAPIPWSLPATEMAALGLALWMLAVLGSQTSMGLALASLGLGYVLLLLTLIDARTFLLPDWLTLPLIPAGLGVTAWLSLTDLPGHALAAVAGYGAIWLINELYLRMRGREGIGLGDAKLLAAAGAWLGPLALPSVLLLGACSGLIFAGLGRLTGRDVSMATAIPFGPFLALGFWITWLHGPIRFDLL